MTSCVAHGGLRPAKWDDGDAQSGAPPSVWRVLPPLGPENLSAPVSGFFSWFQSGFGSQAAVKQKPEEASDVGRSHDASLSLGAMNGRLLIAALSLSLLAGCVSRKGPPAPVVQSTVPTTSVSAAPMASTPVAARAASTADSAIVVRQGETLYAVAQRANVPVRGLIEANNLQPPYALSRGQRLNVPQQQTHQVQSGDTLANIARRYGLGTNEIVRANQLTPPYAVKAGQILTLPSGAPEMLVAGVTPNAASSLSTPPPSPPGSQMATEPTVERAPRGAVESATLAPLSGVSSSPLAAPISAPAPTIAAASSPIPAAAPAPTAVASLPTPVPVMTPPAAVQPVSLPMPSSPLARPDADDDEPAARPGTRGFLWPVRGSVISDYGAKPGGMQNDGINIAAPKGAPIRAAEAGSVVYAGNDLKGFGNLLLVRHKDGWITAYAHADELLVKRGDDVIRGQTIARVGSTGGVGVPQLHFEIRRGSRPLNPRDYLGPQTASATP